jgi:hypothetical protein
LLWHLKRAEALERIQVLNPQAKLTFESADIADKDEDYLRAFNVICISNQTLATIVRRPTSPTRNPTQAVVLTSPHVLSCVVGLVLCRWSCRVVSVCRVRPGAGEGERYLPQARHPLLRRRLVRLPRLLLRRSGRPQLRCVRFSRLSFARRARRRPLG